MTCSAPKTGMSNIIVRPMNSGTLIFFYINNSLCIR